MLLLFQHHLQDFWVLEHKVAFDPIKKLIIVNDGIENLNFAIDIYSAWKEWVIERDNAKYDKAIRYIGGDPISDTQNAGTTFFLINGWRIKPAERDHKLTVVGNLFTDPAGQNIFEPTDGDFNVNTEIIVSNLVDSSVARLDLNQLLSAIYVDTTNGSPGTDITNGTPTNPVNNLTDALSLSQSRNIPIFRIRGNLTLDQNVNDIKFIGDNSQTINYIDFAGFNVDGCSFESCTISGTMTGRIVDAKDCALSVLKGLNGRFRDCILITSFEVEPNSNNQFVNCDSDGVTSLKCVLPGQNARIAFHDFTGTIALQQMDSTDYVEFNGDGSTCVLDNTNTGGIFIARGTVNIQNDLNSNVTIIDERIVPSLNQISGAVYIDVENGTSGLAKGIGSNVLPVNNIEDGYIIAQREGVREFRFRGNISIDRNYSSWTFTGLSSEYNDFITVDGYNLDKSRLSNCTLQGALQGLITCEKCRIDVAIGLNGMFRNCSIVSSFTIADDSVAVLDSCFSEVPGSGAPIATFGTNSDLNVRNYSGGIRLEGLDIGNSCSVDLDPGKVTIGASCVGGEVLVRGVGEITNISTGVNIINSGLLNPNEVHDIFKIHGLEIQSPLIVTNVSRTAGNINQTIEQDGYVSTTVTRI